MGGLKGRGSEGTVLLDVLIGLFITTTALLLLLGGTALAARSSRQIGERVERLIADRSEYAERQQILFVLPSPQE